MRQGLRGRRGFLRRLNEQPLERFSLFVFGQPRMQTLRRLKLSDRRAPFARHEIHEDLR